MQRLFTFGCSFTQYLWPTWADLLGTEIPLHFNWGNAGLGNRAIAERVAEAHARTQFTPDDIVIVQWSSHLRHDWMRTNIPKTDNSLWRTKGSIFTKHNATVFDNRWINTFWDEKAYYIHTMNNILLTQGLLKSTGVKWMMTSMNDLSKVGNEISADTMHGEYHLEGRKLYDALNEDSEISFYKEAVWTNHADHWVDPIIEAQMQAQELSWWFKGNPDDGKVHDRPLRGDGCWQEAHPSVEQHALWLLELKQRMGEEPTLTASQRDLINEFNEIKARTATYLDFENEVRKTDWYKPYTCRGF